jgi:hypothetical protein
VLQLIRNNSPHTLITLFVFTFLVKIQALLHPILPVSTPNSPVYQTLLHVLGWFFGKNAWGYTLLAVLLLLLQALYLNFVANRYRLFPRNTYMPAFVYIFLSAITPIRDSFNEMLLVNFCLIATLNALFRFAQSGHPHRYIFNAGFFISLAMLLQFSAVVYILLLVWAMLRLRPFNANEWFVGFLGLFTPIYFLGGILFLIDQVNELRYWPVLQFSLPRQVAHPVYLIGCMLGFIVLTASGLFALQRQMPKSTVFVRRSWSVIAVLAAVSLWTAVFTPTTMPAATTAWVALLPGFSLIAAYALLPEKSRWFRLIFFCFLLALLVWCQIFY